MNIQHRNGGTITRISHVGHETYKGVADWFFIGDVTWRDGSKSDDAKIAPFQLCHDNDDEKAEIDRLMKQMNDYLASAGEWHAPESRSFGRVVSWTPKMKANLVEITPAQRSES